MRPTLEIRTSSSERRMTHIRRATCKHYSAEKKIRIVLDGLHGESSMAGLCRREGTTESSMRAPAPRRREHPKLRIIPSTS